MNFAEHHSSDVAYHQKCACGREWADGVAESRSAFQAQTVNSAPFTLYSFRYFSAPGPKGQDGEPGSRGQDGGPGTGGG